MKLTQTRFRYREKIGKYRVERRIAEGGFAQVYQAFDTIEGIRVALKILHPHLLDNEWLECFRREVRLVARLDHPNVLPLKNASFIDDHFVVVTPLAERSLAERLQRRISVRVAVQIATEILEGLAFAHRLRVMHCDIKPENLLVFPGNRIRLADFGIARVAHRTVSASGSGTLGYMAPEQAMGAPSFRSDVFSVGLVLYQMFAGELPGWPFKRPLPGIATLRRKLHRNLVQVLLKAIELEPQRRFRDANSMLRSFLRARPTTFRKITGQRRRRASSAERDDWSEVRWRQFRRIYGQCLQARFDCGDCGGPVSEAMLSCPWCRASLATFPGTTREQQVCPRCRRGRKPDWRYCPWCYGPGFSNVSDRECSDVRYEGKCSNDQCRRKVLFPFMRYCPWCRRKVRKKWKIPDVRQSCPKCGWGVVPNFWDFCPWCSATL